MSRPTLEVADIIRAQGKRFIENNRSWLRWPHLKVLQAIERCRVRKHETQPRAAVTPYCSKTHLVEMIVLRSSSNFVHSIGRCVRLWTHFRFS